MQYLTRGNSHPKVYFTGHPADCKTYFDRIVNAILALHDCAVFYEEMTRQSERPGLSGCPTRRIHLKLAADNRKLPDVGELFCL